MNFEEWLSNTQAKRDELTLAGKYGSASHDINKAIEMIHEAENLRNEAESYLIQAKEQAMFQTRQKKPDLSNRERELIEKKEVLSFKAVFDACETTVSSLTRRYFSWGKM